MGTIFVRRHASLAQRARVSPLAIATASAFGKGGLDSFGLAVQRSVVARMPHVSLGRKHTNGGRVGRGSGKDSRFAAGERVPYAFWAIFVEILRRRISPDAGPIRPLGGRWPRKFFRDFCIPCFLVFPSDFPAPVLVEVPALNGMGSSMPH